jgi:hypothetical protein
MKIRLRDVVELRTGYLFRGKVRPNPKGTVRVVQIKDVDAERRINVAGLDRVTIDKPELYLIEPGDVLFLSRGHRLYGTVVPQVKPNTIATGYFFIMRPKSAAVFPEYLAWTLNQASFQESLKPFHRGSHIPMVSRTDVENLKIELPPVEVQRRVMTLNELVDRERHLMTAIQEKRATVVQAVSRKLILEADDGGDRQAELE